MKKALPLIAAIFLVSLAASFPVSLNVVDRKASPESPAKFEVEIQNNHSSKESFRVSPRAGNLDWFFNDGPITLQPSENGTVNLTVTPSVDAFQHNWEFDLRVWMAGTNNYEVVSSYYRVEKRAELNVVSSSILKDSVRPGESNRVNITIRNLGSERLDNYSVVLDYRNETVERQGEVLLPGTVQRLPESRTFNFDLDVPANHHPGNLSPSLTVMKDGEEIDNYDYSFRVEEVMNISKGQNATDNLWGFSKTVFAENKGNVDAVVIFDEEVPVYVTPFIAYDREPDSVASGQSSTIYTWNHTLSPGEKASINYRVNYWMPALIILLIVGGLVLLKKIGRTATVLKTARRDGDFVKVTIELQNSSDQVLENLKVVDFVPDLASVSQDFPVAKPEIHQTSEGARLEWVVEALQPGEERVLEYHVKPKVEVEGGITLRPVEIKQGEEVLAQSSECSVEFRPE